MKHLTHIATVKNSLFKTLAVGITMTAILMQPLIVFACGVSITPSQASGEHWTYGNDSAEQSFINYDNGVEKLIISRDFNNGSKDTVWVIPIPAPPDSIKTDVLSDTPRLEGYDVVSKARAKVPDIRDGLLATQLYPAIPKLFTKSSDPQAVTASARSFAGADGIGAAASNPATSSVVVYDHLEKNGMVTEVLSAGSSDDLYTYLKAKGLQVQKDSIDILRDYIGKDFSFVASWIKPTNDTDPRKGVQMTFPSKTIFYPLKPGSVYPGAGLPETINVIGHVSPKLYANIKDQTKVEYFYSPDPTTSTDFFSSEKGYGFTKITVNVAPKALTEDLYISKRAPTKITLAQAIISQPIMVGIVLFILITLLSSFIALKFVYWRAQTHPSLLGIGFLSWLGILGAVVASLFILKEGRLRRASYVVAYSAIFVSLTLLSGLLLTSIYTVA